MHKIFLFLIVQLLSQSFLQAQEKIKIPRTNLKISLGEEFIIDEETSTIYNKNYGITFIEMGGISYYEQVGDFDNIEEKYKDKGVIVTEQYKAKVGQYDAIFLNLESNPSISQIFFGDSTSCALANIIAQDSNLVLNFSEIDSLLSSIEFYDSQKTALEEHAHFKLNDEQWNFKNYFANVFVFENDEEETLVISQFPPMTLMTRTKEDFAKELINRLGTEIPSLVLLEEGAWKAKNFETHKVFASVNETESVQLVCLFVFSGNKSDFSVQVMGKKNDELTKEKFEDLINKFEVK